MKILKKKNFTVNFARGALHYHQNLRIKDKPKLTP